MSATLCPREDELLDALGRGFVGAELTAHLEQCPSCAELRLVAGALLDDRTTAAAESAVPAAGTMWWRMQIRLRHEAQTTSRRSLFIGQALTLIVALALIGTFFGSDLAAGAREVIAVVRVSTPLLLALATSLLVVPIAGWVALRQK
jgi:predicted anti-sigma-YlaC factor YlaD